jgi:transposase InsO family protein
MLIHIDASQHQWFCGERWHDLIVILDDATSEIYYAQLVEEESTRTVLRALRQVVEREGLFCSLYSDRASHFWTTPKAGEAVDRQALTQVGRAMRELNIRMIPAYSPQARGRSERSFRTWQGRLPQELRLEGITTPGEANRLLQERYAAEFNARFSVAAAGEGTAFVPCRRTDLGRVFSLQHGRVVARDNTVSFARLTLQIERQRWRSTLAGCRVRVYEHLDGTLSLGYGAHQVGRYSSDGTPLKPSAGKDEVKKTVKKRAA